MQALLSGVTANTTGDWVDFEAGRSDIKMVVQFAGLDGATGSVEISYDGGTTFSEVYSTTDDGLQIIEPVGNLSAGPTTATTAFKLRGKIADAQGGTDATIGVT